MTLSGQFLRTLVAKDHRRNKQLVQLFHLKEKKYIHIKTIVKLSICINILYKYLTIYQHKIRCIHRNNSNLQVVI